MGEWRQVNSRTHMLVGAAAALAILQPTDLGTVAIDIAAGTLGGWLCDVDVNAKSSVRDYFFGFDIAVPLTAVVLADWLLGLGIASRIVARWGSVATAGVLAFVVLAVLGARWKGLCAHRTFMHSLLATGLFSCALWLAFPPAVPAFAIGMALHIALDLTNRQGVQVLFPLPFRPCLHLFASDGRMDKILRAAGLVATVSLAVGCVVG